MPAATVAERVGWSGSPSLFRAKVAQIRPEYSVPDPADRLVHPPGFQVQCDLWFPREALALGHDQHGTPPVLVMTSTFSGCIQGRMLPTRTTPDLLGGMWPMIQEAGAVPARLIWDSEAGIGRAKLTESAAAFAGTLGTLGTQIKLLRARDPESKGMVERSNRFFKTAAAEELPAAVAVMDPFHVVRLAGDALDGCRRRVQQQLHGHRGRTGDPLYSCRRTLHTGLKLLTDTQWNRLDRLFDIDEHAHVEVTWALYQRMVTAYRDGDRAAGRLDLAALIESLRTGVPGTLVELRKLGRTLNARKSDVLAYFDRPGTSNGPTEAINGRLEHLRGTALGFRNLANYITRSLLETGGFRPLLHPRL